MKKCLMITLIALILSNVNAQETKDIALPAPKIDAGMPLMKALANRQSNREFSGEELNFQTLSNLLWAANGVNRENGKRTAPSARNMQQIEIYVFMKKGVFLYNPIDNILEMKYSEDHRSIVPMQDFAAKAPVLLLFVANYEKMNISEEAREFYGATDCGNVSQNVYLFCASEGLNTVALGSIKRDELKNLLQFNGKAILGQPVGYPKEKEKK